MILLGMLYRVGDALSSAQVIAPEYAGDPAAMAAFCLDGLLPTEGIPEGSVLATGHDFGAGEGDPELAVLALQAAGVAALLCVSAAPRLVAAAAVFGLPLFVAPASAALAAGTQVRIDLERARLRVPGQPVQIALPPLDAAALAAVRRARLLGELRMYIDEEGLDD